MAGQSGIEWTEATWNPIASCTKVSLGCKNCCAERMSKRLKAMGNQKYAAGFKIMIHKDQPGLPLTWKKPRMIFVNSMSDLFHEDVPLEFIQSTFEIMREANWHTYQIFTKRSHRLYMLDGKLEWPSNVWMGMSVENADYVFPIDHLRDTHAQIKFISLESLIGPLGVLNLRGIDWVIVGGESGPRSCPVREEWVTKVRDQCNGIGIPFFFKQWGGFNKKADGRGLEGRTWDQMPRQFYNFHSGF